MKRQNAKKSRRLSKKAALVCAALVALLMACLVLSLIKPPMDEVRSHISPELIRSAGKTYSEASFNFLILNITRGSNAKITSTDVETYIGIAGRVFPANDGAVKTLADTLFWLPSLLDGAQLTVALTVVSVLAGLFLSIFLALGKISNPKRQRFMFIRAANAGQALGQGLRWCLHHVGYMLTLVSKKFCHAYIFFFRGTPLLMQLFFIYFGLPLIHESLTINDKFLAAFIAFTLNVSAYCAEFIRAAIQSIDKGQTEASRALGLSYGQAMRLVIIPQSFRRLIPPVANEFIMVLKDVSLVSIIALTDLTHQTRVLSNAAGSALVFVPAMIVYLIITAIFTFIFNRLEKRYSVYV